MQESALLWWRAIICGALSVTSGLVFVRGEQKGSGAAASAAGFHESLWIKHEVCNCLQLGKAGMMIPVLPLNPMVQPSLIPCIFHIN